MENEQEKLMEENVSVIEKWSDYVQVSLTNGKSVSEIRHRLKENHLTDVQIDLLFNPKSRRYINRMDSTTRTRAQVLGTFKVVAGLILLGTGTVAWGIVLLAGGIFWLVGASRGEE